MIERVLRIDGTFVSTTGPRDNFKFNTSETRIITATILLLTTSQSQHEAAGLGSHVCLAV